MLARPSQDEDEEPVTLSNPEKKEILHVMAEHDYTGEMREGGGGGVEEEEKSGCSSLSLIVRLLLPARSWTHANEPLLARREQRAEVEPE